METKRCFRCDKIKPLDAFNTRQSEYRKEQHLGYCTTCIKCMIKHTSADMKGMIYNFDTGKFEVKHFKTKKEIKEHYEREAKKNGAQRLPIESKC